MGHCLISAITQSSIRHCPTVYRPAAIFSFTCQFCLESTSFVVTSAVTNIAFLSPAFTDTFLRRKLARGIVQSCGKKSKMTMQNFQHMMEKL